MPKIPMHVVAEAEVGEREVRAAIGPGSVAYSGANDGRSFLCGSCRAIVVKSADPEAVVTEEHIDEDRFAAIARVRDIVWRCKRCGAFNEIRG